MHESMTSDTNEGCGSERVEGVVVIRYTRSCFV